MKELPDKPSELIRLALEDLEAIEKDSRYQVNMDTWHNFCSEEDSRCSVCFAGAVMARSLNSPLEVSVEPADFDEHQKLEALDAFRLGMVEIGLGDMDIYPDELSIAKKFAEKFPNGRMIVQRYEHTPDGFKKDMRKMVKHLRELGL